MPHSCKFDLGGHRLIGKVEFPHFTPPEELIPMTDDRLPLAELMAKAGDGDFLRSNPESVLQIIMEPMSRARSAPDGTSDPARE